MRLKSVVTVNEREEEQRRELSHIEASRHIDHGPDILQSNGDLGQGPPVPPGQEQPWQHQEAGDAPPTLSVQGKVSDSSLNEI